MLRLLFVLFIIASEAHAQVINVETLRKSSDTTKRTVVCVLDVLYYVVNQSDSE